MAQVNLVQKRMKMGLRSIIKFQILTHCFMNDIRLSENELDCLTLLGAYGPCELADFCNTAVEEKIFKTSQTVRNFLTKAESINLIHKNGSSKKKISLKDNLNVQVKGNIVLDMKIAYVAQE